MEMSTSKQEMDSLLQQSKKRLKESLKPLLLKRITLKVPEDEKIHYVHYQWSNSDRSMNIVMAIFLPACAAAFIYIMFFWEIGMLSYLASDLPDFYWFVLICIGLGTIPFLLRKRLDQSCIFSVIVFTNKAIHTNMRLAKVKSIYTPSTGTIKYKDIKGFYFNKVKSKIMKPYEGIPLLAGLPPVAPFQNPYLDRFSQFGPFPSLEVMKRIFESIVLKYQPIHDQAALYYGKEKKEVPDFSTIKDFSISQQRIDKMEKKKRTIISWILGICGITVAAILIINFISSKLALEDDMTMIMISWMVPIMGPFIGGMIVAAGIAEYKVLTAYKLDAGSSISVGNDGIAYIRDGREISIPFGPSILFKVTRSAKNETWPLWRDSDTLVLMPNGNPKKSIKIGPIDDFPDFYYSFLEKHERWLQKAGMMADPRDITNIMLEVDPFKLEIIKKVSKKAVELQQKTAADFKPKLEDREIEFKPIPDSRLNLDLKYPLESYKVYLEEGENIIFHYKPKHLVEQFFSPGFIGFIISAIVILIINLNDEFKNSIGYMGFLVPLLSILFLVVYACMFFMRKVPKDILLKKVEIVFTEKKMIISWGNNLSIVPKENIGGLNLGNLSKTLNVYRMARISFKSPLNQSPYLLKNVYFLYWLDEGSRIIQLFEKYAEGT
ncbi:MAG: hypothetical protein ACFFCS_25735 [Candidatus Hodarchaeota archaeon]